MHAKLSVVAIVVAAIVTGVAAAGHTATPQRIVITSVHGNSGIFTLTPLTSGPVTRDSGTATACCWTSRHVRRDGQSMDIDNPLRTFQGKHGTFTWRASIEWVDLDSNYSIGTGTWRIVRGTGAYAHLEGHGRIGIVTGPNDQGLADRADGLVDLGR